MSYFECDGCGTTEYSHLNPFVEIRVPRPSDRSDLCCIMAGCSRCFPPHELGTAVAGGSATPEQWEDYIESPEAMKAGFMFLT